jgi:hypothetical protein
LLTAFDHGDAQERNQLEAIKTAGTVMVGKGDAHALQEQMAEDTRLVSAERRLTELSSTAVDQLGSERLAAQLGGLYALERIR